MYLPKLGRAGTVYSRGLVAACLGHTLKRRELVLSLLQPRFGEHSSRLLPLLPLPHRACGMSGRGRGQAEGNEGKWGKITHFIQDCVEAVAKNNTSTASYLSGA
ncbi:hypothetical protein ElyMa_003672500 [Elysia marginata]|uniref:Uncharacterized protein n=1 Tax=Elysia marginata TaxID=1093978 RepID=A0AAV4EZI8_9GAST|nr:hypothetical protein ElyMa_003672500 [Elysia marginata]